MSIELLNLVLVLAAAQGLFLTILLFHKHRNLFANRFLITLILLYSIILLHLLLQEMGYYRQHPQLVLCILGISFLPGPLHFLYAKYLVNHALQFKQRDWCHFSAFIFYEVFLLLTFIIWKQNDVFFISKGDVEGIPIGFIVLNWVILAHVSLYMFFTVLILNRYSRYIKDVFSNIDKIKLTWLRYITYMAAFFIFIFFLENLLLLLGTDLSGHFNLTSVLTALYVYALGYLGLFKSEVFTVPEIAESISQLPELSYQSRKDKKGDENKVIKYEKSGLSEENAKMYLEKLLQLMKNEAPYTNSNLTLNQLAEMLSISPHNLSEVINTNLNKNFFDFVNHYRVEKVKKALVDESLQHLKLIVLAFEAGFNSKSSFNYIFKKYTNLTPTEYRQQNSEKTS